MEIYRIGEYIKKENLTPGERNVQQILTSAQKAQNMGGIFAILPAGSKVPYHYHNKRESIIIAISGEATEIIEGKEIPFKANDVLYIPAIEKHGTVNRTSKDFRYLEFFTSEPGARDFIEVA